jgi:hypothetical protein
LKNEVWEIIGGNPNRIQQLVRRCAGIEEIGKIVVEFLLSSLELTRQTLKEEVYLNPELVDAISMLRTSNSIDFGDLKNPNIGVKSLRILRGDFIPSNPTFGFIFRHGLEEVESMLKEAKKVSAQEKFHILKRFASRNFRSSQAGN